MYDILSMLKSVLRKILKILIPCFRCGFLFFERFGEFCENPNLILSFILNF